VDEPLQAASGRMVSKTETIEYATNRKFMPRVQSPLGYIEAAMIEDEFA